MGITYREYREEIEGIAANLVCEAIQTTHETFLQEAFEDHDSFEEAKRDQAEELIQDSLLHETIDGHQWIIYYSYNLDVIQYSDNEDYMVDYFGAECMADILKVKGLDDLHAAIAFWCMYADVQEELSKAFDEHEEKE